MKNILIGSRAIKFSCNKINIKDTTDYDVISEKPLSEKFEFHDVNILNNYDLSRYTISSPIEVEGHKLYPLNLKGLAIVKRSHLWRDLSFDKHMIMYNRYLKSHLGNLSDEDKYILSERTKETHKMFDKWKSPSLMKSVNDFFDDFVTKKYDHDYIHSLVAHYDHPLYTQLQKDNSTVWCHKDLWDQLSYQDKLKCVAEETYVIALERFIIPSEWKYYKRLAYFNALKKVCTTLTSGWFRDFAIDNYVEICSIYDEQRISLQNVLP